MVEMQQVLALVRRAAEALDVLALDADEAGYPARAEETTELAMELRQALRDAGVGAGQ